MEKFTVKLNVNGNSKEEVEKLFKSVLDLEVLEVSKCKNEEKDYITKIKTLRPVLRTLKDNFREKISIAFGAWFHMKKGYNIIRIHFFRHNIASGTTSYITYDKELDKEIVELRPELRKDFGHIIIPVDEFDINELRSALSDEDWFSGLITEDVYLKNYSCEYENDEGEDVFDD